MSTKTREELHEETSQERKAAQAKFGPRCVSDVLLGVRTKLRMLSDFCAGKVESDGEMSSDGWVGLGDILDDIRHDVEMLDNAFSADVSNWRPGQDEQFRGDSLRNSKGHGDEA